MGCDWSALTISTLLGKLLKNGERGRPKMAILQMDASKAQRGS
jgi:hypothetical protein